MADPNIADAVRVLQVLRILRQGSIAVSTILFRHVGERYTVRFSYDPDLVELLKDTVPACARSWDLMNYAPDIWVPNVYASVPDAAHFSAWRPTLLSSRRKAWGLTPVNLSGKRRVVSPRHSVP
ncbi:MAG: hypothetical protein QOK09_644 [Mycobacterium sp.]|jgi:hypothetical protein|nr:hypothetical protein [Mycobacterium sp.]